MKIFQIGKEVYIDGIFHFEKVFAVSGDLLIKTDFADFKDYLNPEYTYYFSPTMP